jgi:hypothetical protein
MHRIRLIHWNATDAEKQAKQLQAVGYSVDWDRLDAASLRELTWSGLRFSQRREKAQRAETR